jgi:hypothetical protein
MPRGCVRGHRAGSDWRRSERFRCLSASRSVCRCLWPLSLGLSLIKTGHDVGACGFRARNYRSFGIYEDRDEYDGQVQYGGELTHAPRWGAARSTSARRPTCRSRLMITLLGEVDNERGRPLPLRRMISQTPRILSWRRSKRSLRSLSLSSASVSLPAVAVVMKLPSRSRARKPRRCGSAGRSHVTIARRPAGSPRTLRLPRARAG